MKPMLARLVRELPAGDYVYEPKWDGFRCLAVRGGDEVQLISRHGRPLDRYFPELVARWRGCLPRPGRSTARCSSPSAGGSTSRR